MNYKLLKPVNGQILVNKLSSDDNVTSGGIILTNNNKTLYETYCVVQIYTPYKNEHGVVMECQFKVGDKLCVLKQIYPDIEVDNNKYFVIRENNVFGVVY